MWHPESDVQTSSPLTSTPLHENTSNTHTQQGYAPLFQAFTPITVLAPFAELSPQRYGELILRVDRANTGAAGAFVVSLLLGAVSSRLGHLIYILRAGNTFYKALTRPRAAMLLIAVSPLTTRSKHHN